MNFLVKTSLGILLVVVLVYADVDLTNIKFKQQCQILQCNSSIEICRINPQCKDELIKCIYCALKNDSILPSPRLLATSDPSSYDEYYEYDENEPSDKTGLKDGNEYLDDYIEPFDTVSDRSQPIRKLGICPKVVEAIGKCDTEKTLQPDCRFDTDCPGDFKCCEAACGKRVCNTPIKTLISLCPKSFECSLNCRLGYRTDSNGCLKCECQSCPSMDQCNKKCPSGYLKDLFGCDICECNEQCPPFSCNIFCPHGIGFVRSENGCPLCQCAISKSPPIENTSSCQEDVHCPPGFRCLNDARNVPMCQAVPPNDITCPSDFASRCDLQCPNGNYLLDNNGCPTCACVTTCPQIKCRANCGKAGYVLDKNGCQTCKCVAQVECSRVMCRMYCANGFKRDENGCEYCACNQSPQPCPELNCERSCSNGYRKDYSGCPTCDCQCRSPVCEGSLKNCKIGTEKDANGCPVCTCEEKPVDKCLPIACNLQCKYDFQRDESGCQVCACNQCPMVQCRIYCMYGFLKSQEDGCDLCECDWTPVAERIQCDERIPCPGTRVCNMKTRVCEIVSPDRVNWFLYDFEVKSEIFNDEKFVQTFKNGLIHNIAAKYGLELGQIAVSSVEQNGLTSFQIMPYFTENMDIFDKKMDQIDFDLNSHEFRSVLPAVASIIEDGNVKYPAESSPSRWGDKLKILTRSKSIFFAITLLIAFIAFILLVGYINIRRRQVKLSIRSESKTPIYDTSYHLAPTDDDRYHAVSAPDGTKYVVVESDGMPSSNNKPALV